MLGFMLLRVLRIQDFWGSPPPVHHKTFLRQPHCRTVAVYEPAACCLLVYSPLKGDYRVEGVGSEGIEATLRSINPPIVLAP